MASTRGGSCCSPRWAVARLYVVMQIRRALRGESMTVAAVPEDTRPSLRCSQRKFPVAASATSGRLGEVFDRWAAMTAQGGGRSTLAAEKPKRGSKSASRACTSRGTRFARRSRVHVCFIKNESVPTVFYDFAASRPEFVARNLPNSLARHGTALSGCPGRRSVSFPWRFCLAGAMSRLKCRLHAFFRFIGTKQKSPKKHANEENRGNYQTFQAR